jgi:cardiolipin synthase
VSDVGAVLTGTLALYALVATSFIILENRRPQATLAWLLVFFFAPGIGLLVYVLFGRDRKAFSKQTRLLMQDLQEDARPVLSPILSRQDAEITRLETGSPSRRKLMMLVRHNSRSALTRRNTVEILQDAAQFYPKMMEDMRAARHSIHINRAPLQVGHFQHRRSHSVPYVRHHAESPSPSQCWRHGHHHVVRRDRER